MHRRRRNAPAGAERVLLGRGGQAETPKKAENPRSPRHVRYGRMWAAGASIQGSACQDPPRLDRRLRTAVITSSGTPPPTNERDEKQPSPITDRQPLPPSSIPSYFSTDPLPAPTHPEQAAGATASVAAMAAPAGAQPGDLTDPNLIIRKYQIMQQECQALAGKVCLAYANAVCMHSLDVTLFDLTQEPHQHTCSCKSWRWSWASTSWW